MSLAPTVPQTPRRKRAASGPDHALHSTLIRPSTSPNAQSTPDVQDVPDLDWLETPRSNDDSPSTPSPPSTPSKVRSSDKDLYETPTRKIKGVRRLNQLNSCQLSTSDRLESVESCLSELEIKVEKIDPVFPLHFFTPSPIPDIRDAEIFWGLKGNAGPKTIDLLGQSTAPPSFSKPDGDILQAVRLALHHPLRSSRGHLNKRAKVKGAASITESAKAVPGANHTTAINKGATPPRPPLHRQPRIKTESIPRTPTIKSMRTASGLNGSTGKRFTRILSMNTIEWLMESPGMCVASLVDRPDKRCSVSTRSTGDIESRMRSQLAGLKDPLDLIACEDYIRGLVNSFTCSRYHYPIATVQLDALLDRFHDLRPRRAKCRNDFTTKDLESVRPWLEALTKIPEEKTQQRLQTTSQITESTSTDREQLDDDVDSDKRSQRQDHGAVQSDIVKIDVQVSLAQTAEENESALARQKLQGITQILQTVTSLDLSNALHRTDASGEDETVGKPLDARKIRVSKTNRDSSEAQTPGSNKRDIAKHSTSVSLQTRTSSQATRETKTLTKVVPFLSTNKAYNLSREPNSFSRFVSTQIVDVNFMGTSSRTSLAAERAKVSFVESVNALHQQFRWYYPTLNYPADHYIRDKMYKKLSEREKNTAGHIYMYWIVGSFDFVKIGMTTKDSAIRIRQWRSKCGHEIQEYTPIVVNKTMKLPHVHRLEGLIHAELREARLVESACKKCSEKKGSSDKHIEWFAISASHAQRVIKKWSDWISTHPYVAGELETGMDTSRIDELCTPLPLSVRDTAAFTALKPLVQANPLLPLASSPKRTFRQRRRKPQHNRA